VHRYLNWFRFSEFGLVLELNFTVKAGTLVLLKDLSVLNLFLEDVKLDTASLTRYRVGQKR